MARRKAESAACRQPARRAGFGAGSLAAVGLLSASLWPLYSAQAQDTSDGATASGSPQMVEPSLGGSGGGTSAVPPSESESSQPSSSGTGQIGADFAQRPSNAFAFASGFRGDCEPARKINNFDSELAAPLDLISPPPGSGSRYLRVSLSASETYTDNLNRESSGNAESDLVTQVSPRVDLCTSTGRIRGTLSYSPQLVVYASNSDDNDIYNSVQAQTTVDLWPGHLYLDADTRYGQSVIDPSISYSQSNSLAPSNQTGTWTSNISPYAIQSFGPLGTASLRYRYGKTLHDDDNVPDYTVNGYYFNLNNPPTAGRLTWNASAQTQKVERSGGNPRRFFRRSNSVDSNRPILNGLDPDNPIFDALNPDDPIFNAINPDLAGRDRSGRLGDRTTYFDRASLQLGYQVTRLVRLIGVGGIEDEYQDDGTNDRWSAPFWSAGVRLGSLRNTLEVRTGHHYYGQTFYVDARHRGDTVNYGLSYEEQASSAALDALNNNGGYGSVYASSVPGSVAGVPIDSQFDRGPYIEKRLEGQISVDLVRSSTGLTVYRRRREYADSRIEDEIYTGASLESQYELNRRTSVIPRFNWHSREPNGNAQFDGGYDQYDLGAAVTRALNTSSQASLGYGHSWRDSDRGSGYRENRVTLQYLKNF